MIPAKFFWQAPHLEKPLNEALDALDGRLRFLDREAGFEVVGPFDFEVTSNTPTAAPWPMRLAKVVGAPVGLVLVRAENMTTPGVGGVSTALGISAPQWFVENGTIYVRFVSGLTLNATYRLTFGVLYG